MPPQTVPLKSDSFEVWGRIADPIRGNNSAQALFVPWGAQAPTSGGVLGRHKSFHACYVHFLLKITQPQRGNYIF